MLNITDTDALSSRYPTGIMTLGGQADLFDEVITVSTNLTNSDSLAGSEVAQQYLSFPEEALQPLRVLRGFEKVSVAAGQTTELVFSLRRRDISYWDVDSQNWTISDGQYTVSLGSSSRDLRSNNTFTI